MSHTMFKESMLLKSTSLSSLVSAYKTDIIPRNHTCCDSLKVKMTVGKKKKEMLVDCINEVTYQQITFFKIQSPNAHFHKNHKTIMMVYWCSTEVPFFDVVLTASHSLSSCSALTWYDFPSPPYTHIFTLILTHTISSHLQNSGCVETEEAEKRTGKHGASR